MTLKLSNIVTTYKKYEQDNIACAKACVELGGGVWVGTMDCVDYTLALFNSPQTGSTLALKMTAITPELVRSHIKASDRKFARGK